MLSPFENSGGYGRVGKLGVPVIECADYMETSPLGRAEWLRFYGLLVGQEQRGDSLFAQIEKEYLALKDLAAQATSRPTVLSDLKYGSAWYIAGGQSTTDACMRMPGRLCFCRTAEQRFCADGF